MDLVDRLVEHDLWLTERILRAAGELTDPVLDASVQGECAGLEVVAQPSIRRLLEVMVLTKEVWGAGMTGDAVALDARPSGLDQILARWSIAAARFRAAVEDVARRDAWDQTFIRTTWDVPETFTNGQAVAHTLTFSACRTALALRLLQARGVVLDLGSGDPLGGDMGPGTDTSGGRGTA